MRYLSPKGTMFEFDGWNTGDRPTECFDRGDYVACIHGCMLALIIKGSPYEAQLSISDDGVIHELIHMISGVDICTCNSVQDIRAEVSKLEKFVLDTLSLGETQTNANTESELTSNQRQQEPQQRKEEPAQNSEKFADNYSVISVLQQMLRRIGS